MRSFLLFASLALSSCVAAGTGPSSRSTELTALEFGRSVKGRPIRGMILGSGPETLLVFGAIHGDERMTATLVRRLASHLKSRKELLIGRRIILVPVSNPDGLASASRHNANGVDLNRNFPARNFVPSRRHGFSRASEPETRILVDLIQRFRPRRILSVHGPLHCVNFDGPASALAASMGRLSGYPVKPSIGYPTPGSFGSYAGKDLGTPTITLELPGRGTFETVWRDLEGALEAFVTFR